MDDFGAPMSTTNRHQLGPLAERNAGLNAEKTHASGEAVSCQGGRGWEGQRFFAGGSEGAQNYSKNGSGKSPPSHALAVRRWSAVAFPFASKGTECIPVGRGLGDRHIIIILSLWRDGICVIIHRVPRLRYSGSPRTAVPL